MRDVLPEAYFSLTNIGLVKLVNWMVTIVPIWFVGMTLYQRMYACKNEKEAKKAWYIAGLFEYPVMAFTGVFLGMCARVVFPEAESETAMPLLIKTMLPVGVTGIVIASYFSAIMSTADSCLMASSGNISGDILERYVFKKLSTKGAMRLSMWVTFVIGVLSVVLAAQFTMVLDAILYAYAFMVAGLFIPTLGAFFWPKGSSTGALAAMVGGGTLTLLLLLKAIQLPAGIAAIGFDPAIYGILFSLLLYLLGTLLFPDKKAPQ
jgi:SSS family solute:Na+ symporter